MKNSSSLYQSLLDEQQGVAEEKLVLYQAVTERHVQALWLEQKYLKPLRTVDGQSVVVRSPGMWNAEAGPDFRKAHLCVNGEEWIGDVELHLHDKGWTQHGHHNDLRYNQVILHVSLWQQQASLELRTQSGDVLPQLYLEPHLTVNPARLVQLFDIELYPYRHCTGSGRCSFPIFQEKRETTIQELLESAATWRLEQKRRFLKERAGCAPQSFAAGAAMVLGYRGNAETFLELFLYLNSQAHADEDTLLSSAMGCCGFFDCDKDVWVKNKEYQRLLTLWREQSHRWPRRFQLETRPNRPLNHPIRRLAALSGWLFSGNLPHAYERIQQVWQNQWVKLKKPRDFVRLRQEWNSAIAVPKHPYWNTHYLFETGCAPRPVPLVGQGAKIAILLNAGLPLLWEEICLRGDPQEKEVFFSAYRSLQPADSGKRRYLTHRFFGDSAKGLSLKKGSMEQGAFQIHKDFCTHYEASCEGCPFVDRVVSHLELNK